MVVVSACKIRPCALFIGLRKIRLQARSFIRVQLNGRILVSKGLRILVVREFRGGARCVRIGELHFDLLIEVRLQGRRLIQIGKSHIRKRQVIGHLVNISEAAIGVGFRNRPNPDHGAEIFGRVIVIVFAEVGDPTGVICLIT